MEDQVQVEEVATNDEYTKYLDTLNEEVNQFLTLARAGKTNRSAALAARKASVTLRSKLKDFRQISLENDRKMKEILQEKKAAKKAASDVQAEATA